ncbi:hypothetical protein AB0442_18535 [Kitasatospora sp. NPDC085895]|uniref:hypothetical protein n=1 Tax=Kitasatospora sp. NPDC085895 TaxID=3155057 RepID=UPI00344FE950
MTVVFAVVLERGARQLARAQSVAEAAQRALLRPIPERIGPLQIATVCLAAEHEAQIGGDLYTATRTDGGARMIVGDVRRWAGSTPEALVNHIRRDLLAHAGGRLGDDVAVVAVRRTDGSEHRLHGLLWTARRRGRAGRRPARRSPRPPAVGTIRAPGC